MTNIESTELFRDVFQYMAQTCFQWEARRYGAVSELRNLRVDVLPPGRYIEEYRFRVFLESGLERCFDPSRLSFLGRYANAEIYELLRGLQYYLNLPREDSRSTTRDLARQDGIRGGIQHVFNVEREEVVFDLELRAARQELEEAERLGAPADVLRRLQVRCHQRQCEIMMHRSVSLDVGLDYTSWREPRRRQAQLRLEEATQYTAILPTDRQLRERLLGYFTAFDVTETGEQRAKKRREAEARGLKLLKEHLTPAQLTEYEQCNYFHVLGGDTKRTYRILHGRQINIRELDAEGKVVAKLCFLPGGDLVEGDVMLAQKFALELQETACLKVANRFLPDGGVIFDEAAPVPLRAYEETLLYGRSFILSPNMIANPTRIIDPNPTS